MKNANKVFVSVLTIISLFLMISHAVANGLKYDYEGTRYTVFNNSSNVSGQYDSSMNLTGWIQLKSKTKNPDNTLCYLEAGTWTQLNPQCVESWDFDDGRSNFTNYNSYISLAGIDLKLNSSGTNIDEWFISIFSDTSDPHHKRIFSLKQIVGDTIRRHDTVQVCKTINHLGVCVDGDIATARAAGSWSPAQPKISTPSEIFLPYKDFSGWINQIFSTNVSIKNIGSLPLLIKDIVVTSRFFYTQEDRCSGRKIFPGKTCDFRVSGSLERIMMYQERDPTVPITGVATIKSNDPDTPVARVTIGLKSRSRNENTSPGSFKPMPYGYRR